MDDKTLTALKESIAHWERMRDETNGPGESIGHKSCSLCRLYSTLDSFRSGCCCDGCPVHQSTGKTFCQDTPYSDAFLAYKELGQPSPEFKEAATEEVKFLKCLLPENECTTAAPDATDH